MKKEIVQEIIRYSKVAFDRFLTSAVGGNVSIRDGDTMYITATNTCLGLLSEEDIILCDLDGNVIEGNQKPSKETGMHLQVYRNRPHATCVMHLHPTNLVALTVKGSALDTTRTGPARNKLFRVPSIPFANTATEALERGIDDVMAEMKDNESIFVISEHGSVAFGETLLQCLASTDLAEDTAKVQMLL